MIFDPVKKTQSGLYLTRVSTPKSLVKNIKPLFDLVDEAYKSETEEKGAIFAQIQEGTTRAFFLPSSQAIKLNNFIAQMIKEGL